MKILLSNDDGIDSEGLKLLAETLGKEHEVFVVAPAEQKSAFSHSMTFRRPLYVDKIKMKGASNAYALSGTPGDCVKFGAEFFGFKPDIVLAGPNKGPNIGIYILYSCTVGAAQEGAVLGYPAVALSCVAFENFRFDTCCRFMSENLDRIKALNLKDSVLNINVPNVDYGQIKGVKVVKHGRHWFDDIYEKHIDVEGNKVGWCLTGGIRQPPKGIHCDMEYILENYVTLTPLKIDRTDYELLDVVGEAFEK